MESELKPVRCGCGGEAYYEAYENYNFGSYIAHIMICDKCGMRTAEWPSEAEAVQAWNRGMGTENICKNCKAYFVMGDCGYCKYDDEYPTADGYGCNCFSRRES